NGPAVATGCAEHNRGDNHRISNLWREHKTTVRRAPSAAVSSRGLQRRLVLGFSDMSDYIFSSESVGEGHPDKVADTISDAVLDACLSQDKRSRVACETLVKSNQVVLAGEITTKAKFDYNQVVRAAIRGIGYVNDSDV